MIKKHNSKNIIFPATMLALACSLTAKCQTTSSTTASDPIVDALIEKGILNASEAQKIQAEIAAHQGSSECSRNAANAARHTDSAADTAAVPRAP